MDLETAGRESILDCEKDLDGTDPDKIRHARIEETAEGKERIKRDRE